MTLSKHKLTLSSLLILTAMVSIFLFLPNKKIHAQVPVIEVGFLATKEGILDGIAWQVANLVIQEMSHNIVNWINSGFDGNPAFVTDLDGFLLGIADNVAGSFIEGTELGFLCDPFELQIRQALAINYHSPFAKKIECTLTGVVENIDDFLAGDFSAGGWDGWYELTVRDNPYSQYLAASEELSVRIVNAKNRELNLLSWANGFLSWRECSDGTVDLIGATSCPIVTPGIVIENQLNNTLDSGRNRLIVAKEINEIIGALLTQLTQQALSGPGGLFGLSQSQSGTPSYTSQLRTDTTATNIIINSARETISEEVGLASQNEEAYKNALLSSISTILATETLNETLRVCSSAKADTFAPAISLRKNSILQKVASSDQTQLELDEAQTTILNSTNTAELEQAADLFVVLQAGDDLRTEADITDAQAESNRIVQEMISLQSDINAAIVECNSTNN